MSQEQDERAAKFIANAVAYVTNEPLVFAQYESLHPELFPTLYCDSQAEFAKRMDDVLEHIGGPPRLYLLDVDKSPPPADVYPQAALQEVIEVFSRARKSVLRAHLFMTGSTLLSKNPEMMELGGAEREKLFIVHTNKAFWEHAEAAYIRLFSFWDRIGQVLDFAFFNIRKFDHNGFYSVMEKIAANVAPMNADLAGGAAWKRLRKFQTSEKEDGLKWLLLRRNLIIHSLHLHPVIESDEEDDLFKSQYNHLEKSHREKLRPKDPQGEAELLVGQLRAATTLFDDVIRLLKFTPSQHMSYRR